MANSDQPQILKTISGSNSAPVVATTAVEKSGTPSTASAGPRPAIAQTGPRAASSASGSVLRASEPPESAISGFAAVLLLVGVIAGAYIAIVILPLVAPALLASIVSDAPKAYWYLSRSSAFVSLFLIWLSMVFGLLITGKTAMVWPGGAQAFDLHQHAGLLGLAFALFHALILTGDKYINFTLAQVLIPFASEGYKPEWVGLGQVCLYAMTILALSYYVRKIITQRGWRLLHYLSFALYVGTIVHSFLSGSDTDTTLAKGAYALSILSIALLTIYRVVISIRLRKSEKGIPQSVATA